MNHFQVSGVILRIKYKSYRLLSPLPPCLIQRIMVLGDVQIQIVATREVPPACGTAIHMMLLIVYFILVVRGK